MIDWGKMWGRRNSDSNLRVIRVKTEAVDRDWISVANAFNRTVWLRRPLNSFVDPGVYNVGFDGGLVRRTDYTETYPDLDLKMPSFQRVTLIKSFNLEELQEFRFFLQRVKEVDCDVVYFTQEGAHSSDWDADDEDSHPPIASLIKPEWFSKLPIRKESWQFYRQDLELAIDEMMYYEGKEVVLMHPEDGVLPLIFGVAPQACAILMDRRYYM